MLPDWEKSETNSPCVSEFVISESIVRKNLRSRYKFTLCVYVNIETSVTSLLGYCLRVLKRKSSSSCGSQHNGQGTSAITSFYKRASHE